MKKYLVILIYLCIFAAFLVSCSLFRVTTGRVYYQDGARQIELTADTLHIVGNQRK